MISFGHSVPQITADVSPILAQELHSLRMFTHCTGGVRVVVVVAGGAVVCVVVD